VLKKTTGDSLKFYKTIKGFVVYVCVWARLSMFPVRVVRVLSKHPHGVPKVKYVVCVKDVRTDDLVDLLFKKKRKGDTVKK